MDRLSAIAWIEECARDTAALTAPASGPILVRDARINPTCGDQVSFELHLELSGVVQLRGSVQGCALSIAAASVAVETLEGLPVAKARTLLGAALDHRLTGRGDAPVGDLGILAALSLVPLRRRCVAFPWRLAVDLLDELELQL